MQTRVAVWNQQQSNVTPQQRQSEQGRMTYYRDTVGNETTLLLTIVLSGCVVLERVTRARETAVAEREYAAGHSRRAFLGTKTRKTLIPPLSSQNGIMVVLPPRVVRCFFAFTAESCAAGTTDWSRPSRVYSPHTHARVKGANEKPSSSSYQRRDGTGGALNSVYDPLATRPYSKSPIF